MFTCNNQYSVKYCLTCRSFMNVPINAYFKVVKYCFIYYSIERLLTSFPIMALQFFCCLLIARGCVEVLRFELVLFGNICTRFQWHLSRGESVSVKNCFALNQLFVKLFSLSVDLCLKYKDGLEVLQEIMTSIQ